MLLGVQKRQWLYLLLALLLPLLLNFFLIWYDLGNATILQMWRGTYPAPFLGFLGGPYNPPPQMMLDLLLPTIVLGVLTWLMLFVTNEVLFLNQAKVFKFIESALMILAIVLVFYFVSGFVMPWLWLPRVYDYLLGLPGSPLARVWSLWLVGPITAIILSIAIIPSKVSGRA